MGRKSIVSSDIKISAVEAYLKGEKSALKISQELLVHVSAVKRWIRFYQSIGATAFIQEKKNSYTKELKLAAIEDYLAGGGSLIDISIKYGLRSETQLKTWLIKYNSHKEIKSYVVGGNQIMTTGRKTNLEERIEIVEYCIGNGKNYIEAAKKFQVSYQQVRKWVAKFEGSGIDGLLDRRGKRKSKDKLTDAEKLKLLEAKYKRLEMENELLKKLKEIERRRG